jgi:hypothetical protein
VPLAARLPSATAGWAKMPMAANRTDAVFKNDFTIKSPSAYGGYCLFLCTFGMRIISSNLARVIFSIGIAYVR